MVDCFLYPDSARRRKCTLDEARKRARKPSRFEAAEKCRPLYESKNVASRAKECAILTKLPIKLRSIPHCLQIIRPLMFVLLQSPLQYHKFIFK